MDNLQALKSIQAKLVAAQTLMMQSGRWTNDAGYITDAALWIEGAMIEAASELERMASEGWRKDQGDSRDHDHTANGALDGDDIDAESGAVTWHSSGEDEGPDVGIELGLGEGRTLYLGELSNRTLEQAGIDPSEHSAAWWIVLTEHRLGLTPIAAVADHDAARQLIDALAAALSSAKQVAGTDPGNTSNPPPQGDQPR